ncbi:MAG: beta-L-arabinofuranosidase domain-containing protein [Mangrovibacterium sp.]
MHIRHLLSALIFLIPGMFSCSQQEQETRVRTNGPESISFQTIPFDLDDVRLLDGPFKKAMELDIKTLLNYEPDRLLAKFREEAGLPPRAKHYDGWEAETLAGHSLGHYLNAISMMYVNTGNEEFLKRVNYIVAELDTCQQANSGNYIGAFTDGQEILENEVAKGKIRARGFDLNGLWAPFYTIHKIMDGLYHAYKYCGNQKALEIETRFANWVGTIVQHLNEEQLQEMMNCEFGGMNEALTELYGSTGNEKYLQLSGAFQHKAILDPVTKGQDILAGKHCNTQVPKFIGLARRYELTGDPADSTGAVNFWNMMVHHHAYVAGNFGNYEYLGEPDRLNNQLSNSTAETCCVYNMLKLSRHLFSWTGAPEIMDYYERALLNHILSSQHPRTGEVIYNLSLDMGGHKDYQYPYSFTCCVGTGMENHAVYAKNIYYHNDQSLYITQFIGSELHWKEKGFSLRQTTQFPEEEGTTFEIATEGGKPLDLRLKTRYPRWARSGMQVRINGKSIRVKGEPGSFVSLGKNWNNGDKIEIRFPFSLRTETMPDNKNRIAIFNGPVLLAGILGPEKDPESTDPLYVPVLMTKDTVPANWLVPVEGKNNTFTSSKVAHPRDVELRPFYRTHNQRYTVYWDTYTPEEWKLHQQEYEEKQRRQKELEEKTIDLFRLGEMQPERDHNFRAERSWVGEYKSKKYREAERGGWMSFNMKVRGKDTRALVLEYWGGFSGSRTFDILVEGELIATENITNKKPGEFFHENYALPAELVQNKDRISVKLNPRDGHRAGPVFTARTIK